MQAHFLPAGPTTGLTKFKGVRPRAPGSPGADPSVGEALQPPAAPPIAGGTVSRRSLLFYCPGVAEGHGPGHSGERARVGLARKPKLIERLVMTWKEEGMTAEAKLKKEPLSYGRRSGKSSSPVSPKRRAGWGESPVPGRLPGRDGASR